MRLLHAKTLEFKFINENSPLKYVTLSHTWGDDEVTYQDMLWLEKWRAAPDHWKKEPMFEYLLSGGEGSTTKSEKELTGLSGYRKIIETARITQELGYEYFWIDTCCTIQTHHRRQSPTKRVAYAAENGGRMYIAPQYGAASQK
ncbi:hypothetical protein P154DRAFT_601283 [Amniculicola lignicola CBS 123094]|uniref:Heterokaryon incompatibility domain-containing protein n=1 Tax=Amniculicola lignicola CBS 123094 TaxID=1392246 RepID=A0A6A5WER5_9PLEO|nr:hypothetical protein P154DRAFT_601283 [Amniculicola lignicola CBS 123094]